MIAPVSRSTRTCDRCAADCGAGDSDTRPCPSTGGYGLPNVSTFCASCSIPIAFAGTPTGLHRAVDDLEVLGRDLELLGGDVEQPLARLERGQLDGAPDRVSDLAAAAHASVRRARGVGVVDPDAVGAHAERVGGDRREGGLDAGHVGGAGDDRQTPVGIESAHRGGGLVPARPPPDREADTLPIRERSAVPPQRMLTHPLEALARAEHFELLSGDGRVADDHDVAQSQLQRVDPEALRQLVDQRLNRERRLGRGGSAVGPKRHTVGRDAEGGELVRLPAVRAGGQHRRDRLDSEVVGRSSVGEHAGADAGQSPVAVGPDLDVEDLGAGGIGRGEVLATGHHQPDRSAEHERGADDERLDDHHLAAEAAAERRAANAEPLRREARTDPSARSGSGTAPGSTC